MISFDEHVKFVVRSFIVVVWFLPLLLAKVFTDTFTQRIIPQQTMHSAY